MKERKYNMAHTNKIAKSLLWMKDDPRIRSIHLEDSDWDIGHGEWSYWIYTRGLHYFGLHAIHEHTAKEVMEMFNRMDKCEDPNCELESNHN